jgi:hypothetical protein
MIDKNTLVDGVGDNADDSRHVHSTPESRHWTGVMKHSLPELVVSQKPSPRPNSARKSYARRRT